MNEPPVGLMTTPETTRAAAPASARLVVFLCAVASLGGLLFGFDTAVVSGAIALVTAQFGLTPLQEGVFTSSALVGCIIGAGVCGTLADRFGRKPALIAAGLLFVASAIGCAVPETFLTLLIARALGGIAVGIASVVAPLYITEFAPPQSRGRLVAFYQLSIVCGVLLAYLSNWLIARNALAPEGVRWVGEFGQAFFVGEYWRAMFGAALVPSLAFTILVLLIPESPRWLARRSGRNQQTEPEGSWRELLRPGLRMALLVGVMLSVFGQLSGVNIVVYYGPKILAAAGFANEAALLGQVGFGLINLVVTIIAMLIIDRFGRRPLLIRGMFVVTVALVAIGALFAFAGSGEVGAVPRALGIWIGVLICVYMAAVAISICAVIWVITAEIFPTRVRGRGCSVATFANWSTNACAALLFPLIVNAWGMSFGCFATAVVCACATWFFWRFVPETKGRTLEEIENLWRVSR